MLIRQIALAVMISALATDAAFAASGAPSAAIFLIPIAVFGLLILIAVMSESKPRKPKTPEEVEAEVWALRSDRLLLEARTALKRSEAEAKRAAAEEDELNEIIEQHKHLRQIASKHQAREGEQE